MNFLSGIVARRGYFAISAIVLALDQLTKILAHAYLASRGPVVIIPGFFHLDYSRNPGGLFGFFGDLGQPWRTGLLTVLPILAIGLVIAFLTRDDGVDRKTLFGLSLILGGAVGNLIDRLVRSGNEVVDFLDAFVSHPKLAGWLIDRFGTAHWPTFNVADSAIVCGACLLMLALARQEGADAKDANRGSRPVSGGSQAR